MARGQHDPQRVPRHGERLPLRRSRAGCAPARTVRPIESESAHRQRNHNDCRSRVPCPSLAPLSSACSACACVKSAPRPDTRSNRVLNNRAPERFALSRLASVRSASETSAPERLAPSNRAFTREAPLKSSLDRSVWLRSAPRGIHPSGPDESRDSPSSKRSAFPAASGEDPGCSSLGLARKRWVLWTAGALRGSPSRSRISQTNLTTSDVKGWVFSASPGRSGSVLTRARARKNSRNDLCANR